MKNILLATVATIAMLGVAHATDLPNKKAPPVVPTPAPVVSTADSVSFSVSGDYQPNFGDNKDYAYGLTYTHTFDGGFTGGVSGSWTDTASGDNKYNLEAQAGYKFPLTSAITVGGKVGVGERWQPGAEFPYYALYGTADYKLNDTITINALQYRYRNAFEQANNYESHRLGTGATYNVSKTVALNATVYRDFDKDFNATGDGVLVGATVKF
jgi:hypothetical protein